MRTERQSEASKIDGAKSQGPNTTEGEAKSAQNGILAPGPHQRDGKRHL